MNPDIDGIEWLAAESWHEESMFERMAWLRANDPVHWSEKDGVWLISRFDDVAAVSKDQQLFTSAEGVRPGNPAKIGLIDEGEPRHAQLRSLINKGFTPRMVRQWEKLFNEITDEALDKIASKGECDFVEDIAVPLPILLIAAMIGIPKDKRESFHHWSDTMISADGRLDDPEVMMKAHAAFLEYSALTNQIIEDRRQNPQDDLISILVGAKDSGVLTQFDVEKLPGLEVPDEELALANDELTMLCVILMVAGNETTRNALSGGIQLLIENPDQRQKLLKDPSLIPSACEEMVRLVSPVRSFGRTVTADTELRGKKLGKGQEVLLLYPSANRDENEFEDANTFKVDRNPHHLGFGIGSHFCLGANLARMELRVAFRELLRRFPDMEYAAGGPVLRPSTLVRACVEMQVKYTPEEA